MRRRGMARRRRCGDRRQRPARKRVYPEFASAKSGAEPARPWHCRTPRQGSVMSRKLDLPGGGRVRLGPARDRLRGRLLQRQEPRAALRAPGAARGDRARFLERLHRPLRPDPARPPRFAGRDPGAHAGRGRHGPGCHPRRRQHGGRLCRLAGRRARPRAAPLAGQVQRGVPGGPAPALPGAATT